MNRGVREEAVTVAIVVVVVLVVVTSFFVLFRLDCTSYLCGGVFDLFSNCQRSGKEFQTNSESLQTPCILQYGTNHLAFYSTKACVLQYGTKLRAFYNAAQTTLRFTVQQRAFYNTAQTSVRFTIQHK